MNTHRLEGKYFCNVQPGFRLSDVEKNLKYFDTIDVTEDTISSSRSVVAAIKARWLIKITPEIEKKYHDIFNSYGISADLERSVDDIITPDIVNNKSRSSQAAKTVSANDAEVFAPALSDDIELAKGINADVVGDNIFSETGDEQSISVSDDSGIIRSSTDSKIKAVDMGIPKNVDSSKARSVGKLSTKPVSKVKVAKITGRKIQK